MGWNSWCTMGTCGSDYCDENEIKDIAKTMATTGLKELGWEWIILDDCWAKDRNADGSIHEDPKTFPSSMKALADYVHSLGLKFGLYVAAGIFTCRPPRPGSYGHYIQDAATLASWEVDQVKMDWCATRLDNGTELQQEVQYPQMRDALNQTGRHIFYTMDCYGSENAWEWGMQVSNSWRIGEDHHDRWDGEGGTAYQIQRNIGLSKYSGPGGWNDMDFLMTGGQTCANDTTKACPGMSPTEYYTEFSFWSLLNSPLQVATDIRIMNPLKRDILFNKEVIDVNQDKLTIQGDLVNYWNCSTPPQCPLQVWAKPLSDGSNAVILYNSGKSPEPITAQFHTWGWLSTTASIRDLWKHKELGMFTDSFSAQVDPHGVVMIKATKSSK